MDNQLSMNANLLVSYLQKPAAEFTKEDIKKYIRENEVQMVNFMYPAGDGRLKTLNFVINNESYLDEILTCGERVDGSSLFSFIEAGSSDLYVIPRFKTAFVDPFAELKTVTMLCSYFNKDGQPLESSPEFTLKKACRAFREVTGMDFHAMGELEYYVIAPETDMFPATDQKGYHESAPYAKFNDFRTACMSQNFGDTSTQGSILVSVDSQSAGSTVSITDQNGAVLATWEAPKSFNSVLISCPDLTVGSTYTVTAGTAQTEVTLDSLIYGGGSMQPGQMRGMGGRRP